MQGCNTFSCFPESLRIMEITGEKILSDGQLHSLSLLHARTEQEVLVVIHIS
jgi:hypothetical protein